VPRRPRQRDPEPRELDERGRTQDLDAPPTHEARARAQCAEGDGRRFWRRTPRNPRSPREPRRPDPARVDGEDATIFEIVLFN